MSETITKSSRQVIVREITRWESEKLITQQLYLQLLALYPETPGNGRVIAILMTLGAVLVGLGGLLFIGSNWAIMPSYFKLGLIFLAIIAANYAGWVFKFQPGKRPKLGSAMLLIGALVYGAGIWLISQIFHLDTDLTVGLFLWAAGTVPIALLTGSSAIGVLAIVLISAWNFAGLSSESWGLLWPCYPANLSGMLYFAMSIALQFSVSYRLRSRWCMSISLIFGAIYSASCGGILGLLAYGVAIFAGYLWHRQNHRLFMGPFLGVATIASLGALFLLTFKSSDLSEQYRVDAFLLWIASWIVLVSLVARYRQYAGEIMVCALCLLSGLVSLLVNFELFRAVISNVVLCAALAGLVYAGTNRLKSVAMVNIALVFCVLDICGRYFDFFFKTLDRSIFFVMGGVALMAIGTYLEQNRRKLIEGIR
jgi:uncharacterized membrane protein